MPIKISRAARNALKAETRQRRDAIDAEAEREAAAAEALAELTETPVPISPVVARGLIISAAIALHELFPMRYRHPLDTKGGKLGQYQKQNAQRASERVAKGGVGKREIVTREDKVRRLVRAAARRLDIMAALEADPLTIKAIGITRSMLRAREAVQA